MAKGKQRPRSNGDTGTPGLPIDYEGAPAVDPTENVLALVRAAERRQDDLRTAAKDLYESRSACAKEIGTMRAEYQNELRKLDAAHQTELRKAESERLNSIRQVDREEVSKTAVSANTAITTLAKQTTDLQTTLQKQVADTALAVEQRQSAQYSDTNKRLSALELSSSEGKGKQTIADPALADMAEEIRALRMAQTVTIGKGQGSQAVWGYVVGAIGVIGIIITIISTLRPHL